MQIKTLHVWNVSPKQAIKIQQRLRHQLQFCRMASPPRFIAGTDISYSKNSTHSTRFARSGSNRHFAAVVVLSFPDLKIVDRAFAVGRVAFPYVPGLLSFREVPLLLRAFKKLHVEPDLIFCDGQGYAHPRRLGLACHVGLVLDKPALGVAKSLLCGTFGKLGNKKGSTAPLMDKTEQIGTALRSRDGVAPVYVSVGNRITLKEAEKWVLACSLKYRIPEPTRQAHIWANQLRQLRDSRKP